MTKTLTLAFMMMAALAVAQPQLENTGLESWENETSNTREPLQWNSIKTGGGNASTPNGFVVDKSSTVRPGTTGQFSALLESKSFTIVIVTVTVNGVLTCGRVEAPSFSAADGYIRTKPDDQNFYTSLTDRPDSLVAWINYQPSGSDVGSFEAILHDIVGTGLNAGNMGSLPESGNSQGNNTPQTIAMAHHDIAGNTNGWVRIAVPFTYNDSRTPQYILFTATSSAASGAVVGSKLYIDDLALIYNIAPTPSTTVAYVNATNGYPVSCDFFTNGTPVAATDFVLQISDANGSFTNPTVLGTLNTSATNGTISGTVPAGTVAGAGYLLRVYNASEYYRPLTQGIEVINPEIAIASNTTQNLTVNEAGTAIDLNATLAYQGIEWMFSTTPGGPYTAFNPMEMNMSYTPQFDAIGTYYVVCVVDYGPWSGTSNEVMIVVSDLISTGQTAFSTVSCMAQGSRIAIDLGTVPTGNVTYSIAAADGRKITDGKLSAGSRSVLDMDLPNGSYLVSLSYLDQVQSYVLTLID